jgi:hypothetical protein
VKFGFQPKEELNRKMEEEDKMGTSTGPGQQEEMGGEDEVLDHVVQLSDDALLLVFGLLSARDLHRTSAVCSRYHPPSLVSLVSPCG